MEAVFFMSILDYLPQFQPLKFCTAFFRFKSFIFGRA
ncbi:hypothetical protein SGRA_2639 [Saprospira grandis str. Lewin]|uniref:Uncharacterized protein n=1 Tax=Saprospira grandis (strain Lewin) TaxID=984262 RepID=H6L839_SAPGL|nr:hypothetical protein SGRA_2639 [Saprospira grandis str. Lewin]